MSDRSNVIYCYDGSFDGLMCCVFDSYTRKEVPSDIVTKENQQLTFNEVHDVITDEAHADRILRSIPKKMGENATDFIKKAFLSDIPNRDMYILRFMYMGYKYGFRVMYMVADSTVNTLYKAVQGSCHEAHLLMGFVRFSDNNGTLSAVIEPKNKVLPLMAAHFIDRYRNENFLIYDKTNRMALIYSDHNAEIVEGIDFELPDTTDEEEYYRQLWKTFYNTIGIEERYNPLCRMNLMPKRYWGQIVEMEEEIMHSKNAPRPSGLDSIPSDEQPKLDNN